MKADNTFKHMYIQSRHFYRNCKIGTI
jgi:hypothetical protein